MVVSAGKKADLQRVGMLSSLREISMHGSRTKDAEKCGLPAHEMHWSLSFHLKLMYSSLFITFVLMSC